MFGFINNFIQKSIRKKLLKKKESLIKETINNFSAENRDASKADLEELEKRLKNESIRVFEIVDKSIIRDRVKRGWYTFVGTAILGTVVAAATFVATHGSSLLFVTPLTGAFISLYLNHSTTYKSAERRVKGGFEGVRKSFETELKAKKSKKIENPAKEIAVEKVKIEESSKKTDQPEPIVEKATAKGNSNSVLNKTNKVQK